MVSAVRLLITGLLASMLVLVLVWRGRAAAEPVMLPDPVVDDTLGPARGRSTIVLAGGCFWGVEEVFQHVKGVTDAVSGYSGGSARTASYHAVSSGTSGHAESVRSPTTPRRSRSGRS
jgi:peptide-methionine (S)-S-oxide reductase